MTKIGATPPEPQQPQERTVIQQETSVSSVFAEFIDKDGRVDSQDVSFTTDKTSNAILNFLLAHNGKEWTNSLKFQVNTLIQKFNFESAMEAIQNSFNNFAQKTQDSLKKLKNNTQKEIDNIMQTVAEPKVHKLETSVGHIVPILNNDGSSYKINFKDKTIAKYSPTGELIGQRSMTDEEKSLKSQELINQILNNTEVFKAAETPHQTITSKPETKATIGINETIALEPHKPTPPPKDAKTISRDGISGWYTLTDNGTINFNCNVLAFRNKAAMALKKGFDNANYYSNESNYRTEADSNGYSFRGMFGKTHSILSRRVDIAAQRLAIQTAVYQDLRTKQKNGEALTDTEEKFINNYLKTLTEYKLQINENGDLEDIPVKKREDVKELALY